MRDDNSGGNEWDWLWNKLTSGAPSTTSGSPDAGPPLATGGANPPPAQMGGQGGGDTTDGALDLLGKVWNLPNTALGTAYGILGYGAGVINHALGGQDRAPDILRGPNGLYFTNNPLQLSAMTIGNTTIFGTGDQYQPNSPRADHTLGDEETQHTYQGETLGPFYLPAHGILGTAALINNGGWHGPDNVLETGPHSARPSPWP